MILALSLEPGFRGKFLPWIPEAEKLEQSVHLAASALRVGIFEIVFAPHRA
jgi:hypothetical protein